MAPDAMVASATGSRQPRGGRRARSREKENMGSQDRESTKKAGDLDRLNEDAGCAGDGPEVLDVRSWAEFLESDDLRDMVAGLARGDREPLDVLPATPRRQGGAAADRHVGTPSDAQRAVPAPLALPRRGNGSALHRGLDPSLAELPLPAGATGIPMPILPGVQVPMIQAPWAPASVRLGRVDRSLSPERAHPIAQAIAARSLSPLQRNRPIAVSQCGMSSSWVPASPQQFAARSPQVATRSPRPVLRSPVVEHRSPALCSRSPVMRPRSPMAAPRSPVLLVRPPLVQQSSCGRPSRSVSPCRVPASVGPRSLSPAQRPVLAAFEPRPYVVQIHQSGGQARSLSTSSVRSVSPVDQRWASQDRRIQQPIMCSPSPILCQPHTMCDQRQRRMDSRMLVPVVHGSNQLPVALPVRRGNAATNGYVDPSGQARALLRQVSVNR
eukprot:TRINITY_DN24166_c0_g4_i1.p1 TRINITY_DN24166_c0_g4~~TRINITY_DN24166_c0_g4_i1.p1  ORF type:complete len:450 (-),score=48.71 TRINITY_DN24166_c0_g4_i1:158-1477(-)